MIANRTNKDRNLDIAFYLYQELLYYTNPTIPLSDAMTNFIANFDTTCEAILNSLEATPTRYMSEYATPEIDAIIAEERKMVPMHIQKRREDLRRVNLRRQEVLKILEDELKNIQDVHAENLDAIIGLEAMMEKYK